MYATGSNAGTTFPYSFGKQIANIRPGTYEVVARGAKKPNDSVPACGGTVSMKLVIGAAQLGGPLPTISGAGSFDGDGEYFSWTLDRTRHLVVGMSNSGGRACAATVEITNKALNLHFRPTVVLTMDQQPVSVIDLVQTPLGTTIPRRDYELYVHSTVYNADLGSPCLGELKRTLHVVEGRSCAPGSSTRPWRQPTTSREG